MKKQFIRGIVIALSTLAFTACGTSSTGVSNNSENADVKTQDYTYMQKHIPLKEFHAIIMKAGQENGWRMTEFKENAIIAERVGDGDAESVTIRFSNTYFDLEPKNSQLHDAIESALEK